MVLIKADFILRAGDREGGNRQSFQQMDPNNVRKCRRMPGRGLRA